jgi:hypothetical protein
VVVTVPAFGLVAALGLDHVGEFSAHIEVRLVEPTADRLAVRAGTRLTYDLRSGGCGGRRQRSAGALEARLTGERASEM